VTEPSPYSLAILGALNRSGRHVYAGTTPAPEVARRRKANRVARVSRRLNRKAHS
jgi:hypothetical protein